MIAPIVQRIAEQQNHVINIEDALFVLVSACIVGFVVVTLLYIYNEM